MRKIIVIAGLALALSLPGGPAAGEPTATVDVMLTILPYAEVTVDPTADVYLPDAGGKSEVVYVAGTVTCNCPVILFADIEPPEGAPGDWYATLKQGDVEPGLHVFSDYLVRINVQNVPSEEYEGEYDEPITLQILGSKLGQYPTPQAQAGQVVVTVMQQ